MLDIARLERIRLSRRPLSQRFVGNVFLLPNYRIPPRVEIRIEGGEKLPDERVIYAMNHTDRYNYWPFQFALWKELNRFTATWVKGKYYENAFVGKFMELTNNLPTVSRGYLITRDFIATLGRPPEDSEYAILRPWVDAASAGEVDPPHDLDKLPADLLKRPRNVLGLRFEPDRQSYAAYINSLFTAMMGLFLELNRKALDCGLDLLVFPQGTRSVTLSRGHIGLAEVALYFDRTIVPVGCSGSDHCYRGSSPIASSGSIVYRIGEPISPAEMRDFHPGSDFVPFSHDAEDLHREKFQGLVDVVMSRINELVDPPYRFGNEQESTGVTGRDRFA
jgi:1-acyl-sn-glycerol-3-phosphate acyltransferase